MYNYERLKDFLNKNPQLSIVTEEDGQIIGTVLGSFDGRRGYIQKLVVDEAHRKTGLGRQLIQEVVNKLQGLGATYIPIACEPELVEFYEKCEFKKTGQVSMSLSR